MSKRKMESLLFSRHETEYQSTPEGNGYFELKQALRQGDIEKIRSLILSGVEVNTHAEDENYSPLCLAITLGRLDIVKLLIEKGASINFFNINKDTPLIRAVRTGKFDIADYILSVMDIDDCVNHRNNQDLSLMHIVCMRNKIEFVKKFTERGESKSAAVKERSAYWPGFTALHFAVQYECIETVEFLLSCGADITVKDGRQLTPLHIAFMLENEQIIDLILSYHKYEIQNPINSDKLSHFHIACTRNNVDVVHSFLVQGAGIYMQVSSKALNWPSFRPIDFAIYYECVDVVKLLLSFGACLQHGDNKDLYNLAYNSKNKKLVDLLLSKQTIEKVDTYIPPLYPLSAYCLKAMYKNIEECELSNCEPETLDIFGWTNYTVLHVAVKIQDSELVKFFSQNLPTNIIAKDTSEKTPLHLAFENEQTKLVDLMLVNHESIIENPTNNDGLSHFHIACTRSNLKIIELFLKNGVDVNDPIPMDSKIWPGYTPLHLASEFKMKEVHGILLNNGADISIKNKAGLTAFDISVLKFDVSDEHDSNLPILEQTLQFSSERDCHSFNDRGWSLLHIYSLAFDDDGTILSHYLNLHPEAINKRINWSKSTVYECTPLDLLSRYVSATFNINDLFVTFLIERGADIHFKNSKGEVIFYKLLKYGSELEENLSSLISEADANYVHTDGKSYFHLACEEGYLQIVKYFINQGIDVNLRTEFKSPYCTYDTALHLIGNNASDLGMDTVENMIELLVKSGADINARNATLSTPLHLAVKSDSIYAVRTLLDYGADVDAVDVHGETPLTIACEDDLDGYGKICHLLYYNADINLKNEFGQTPLQISMTTLDNITILNLHKLIVIIKHITKLNMINYYISEDIKSDYSMVFSGTEIADHFKEQDFIEECKLEINKIKLVMIDQYTSLYDVLFNHRMVFHCDNQKLREIIEEEEELDKLFPLYSFLIKSKFKQALIRKPIFKDGRTSFQHLINYSLPDLCVELICQYLSNEDLQSIILSQEKD